VAVGILSTSLIGLGLAGYFLWSGLRTELDRQAQELQSTIDSQAAQLRTLNAQLDDLSRQIGNVDLGLRLTL